MQNARPWKITTSPNLAGARPDLRRSIHSSTGDSSFKQRGNFPNITLRTSIATEIASKNLRTYTTSFQILSGSRTFYVNFEVILTSEQARRRNRRRQKRRTRRMRKIPAENHDTYCGIMHKTVSSEPHTSHAQRGHDLENESTRAHRQTMPDEVQIFFKLHQITLQSRSTRRPFQKTFKPFPFENSCHVNLKSAVQTSTPSSVKRPYQSSPVQRPDLKQETATPDSPAALSIRLCFRRHAKDIIYERLLVCNNFLSQVTNVHLVMVTIRQKTRSSWKTRNVKYPPNVPIKHKIPTPSVAG